MNGTASTRGHLVVVGGGAVGLTSAIAARDAGWRVTLLERGQPGREASWAGGGILYPLLPWHYAEDVSELALAGIARWPDLAARLHRDTGIDPEILRGGMLVLDPEEPEAARAWCLAHRQPVHRHGPRLPWLEHTPRLWLPGVMQVRNPRLLAALVALSHRLGVALRTDTPMTGLRLQGDRVRVVCTPAGELAADAVLLAGGAWTPTLAPELRLCPEVRPVRGQMLLYRLERAPFACVLYRHGHYLVPRRDGHILVGSTLEEAGYDPSVTDTARRDIHAAAAALFPALSRQPILRQWSGLRPGSPGNRPRLGRHPALTNLYLNTGHFRYGVTMAPAAAARLIRAIDDGA